MSYSAFQGNNVADGSRTPSQNYDTRYATALKLFSGEVFNAFNDATIFKGLVRNYSLRGGKSKQFLLTGKLGAGYHTPGTGYRTRRWSEVEREDHRDGSAFVQQPICL